MSRIHTHSKKQPRERIRSLTPRISAHIARVCLRSVDELDHSGKIRRVVRTAVKHAGKPIADFMERRQIARDDRLAACQIVKKLHRRGVAPRYGFTAAVRKD